ncbi:long-chain fatty acid--CoA ligase [Bifidobacterium adolescentis]|uniref:Acyl-CoA synthetase n=1 Tax=Bifidobacterium adolescentis TaxID=1680 RepID=A0A7J5N9P5_BIFAD|nr:long-chain fatty acid--CoA ligase [Bifidobacterium adolescentis]KAB5844689.1 long-chain fatty acid--CoA ligase [Bifidobacterium adolescentis]KAB5857374.1 long-chain fatty acid--CoA ligase [Bifidobacterium adolescentis]KAB5858056.1 long-chain fatty acid--CoA ligase [Bifidobacterium adolescentis]KAB5874722.1 long-chain fatty acid--CoA ligase [Bifidobacterium adolescentis]
MIKEYTRPLEQGIDSDKNIFSVLEERVERTPDDNLVEYKNAQGEWAAFTAAEFKNKVVALAKGLIARGVMPGDSVSIIAHTCWQWTALDVAIMSIGALTVPVYETNSPAQVKMIFNDANVKMAFAEDDFQRDKIESVRDQCPDLGDVCVIGLGAIDTIIEYGRAVSDAEFLEREQAVKGSDLATIVYTSGSTGTPKGVELTHANFVFITYSGVNSMPDIAMKPNRRLLLFLPLAHVFARYMQFFCFAGNVSLGLSGNLKTILADFKAFKPTFILAVPRIFEKIYNAASQKAGAGFKGRVFADATQTAYDWSHAQQSGGSIPLALNAKHALYNKLVYSSIMEVFGGHVEYAVSGGAPLDSSIAHFFNGVGLPLLEGYGMTETCAPSSVNPTEGYKIGTIGLPLQGVTMGVDEEGELCIKSPAVCAGYHNNPDVTKQQIVDGWLHTGDLGSIDDDGFVSIVGRKKDLIITAGGKNVSPCEMEASIMTSPVVSQCVMIGDRKPFIAAIISLDLAETNLWLESKGAEQVADLDEASKNPIVRAEVERAVNKANELASRAESIRKFEIVPDEFTEENGLVTPSMKARRQAVVEHYRTLIDKVIYVPRKPAAHAE